MRKLDTLDNHLFSQSLGQCYSAAPEDEEKILAAVYLPVLATVCLPPTASTGTQRDGKGETKSVQWPAISDKMTVLVAAGRSTQIPSEQQQHKQKHWKNEKNDWMKMAGLCGFSTLQPDSSSSRGDGFAYPYQIDGPLLQLWRQEPSSTIAAAWLWKTEAGSHQKHQRGWR